MSRQVDEKVVSMKFDNKQFEANVKTSMGTIDKLKSSLNFKGASKSLEDLEKASKKVSFDDIAASVQRLENRFSVFGIAGMRVVEQFTDSVIDSVRRISRAATSFIREGIIQGGKRRAMNLENAHFQLQGLLKDEAAVEAVMKNVNDSVDGTAYSLDSAAKVASQFAASGMRAGDQMFSSLRAVAGVAAMTNSEYDEIGRIFTKVAGQGRLMGDDLLSLSSRGMNAAATLAEALGTSESAVREMVSKGKIDFNTFASAMDNAFGEHAKKANETLTGALSNVKAALARIGALFVSPLVKQNGALVQLLNNVRVKINDIKTIIAPVADYVVSVLTNLINKVSEFVKKLDVKKYFSGLGKAFTSSKWDTFIKKINDAGVSTDKFQEKLKEVASKHGVSIDDLIKKYGTLGGVMSAGKLSKSIIVETIKKFIKVEEHASEATTDITDKLEYFNKVVKEVIRGDYGNGEDRVKALTKAGYKYAEVQKLVNYVWERNGKTWSDCNLTAAELSKTISDFSEEELKSIGYTDEQSKKLRELAEEAEKTGTPLNELLSNLEKPTGKELIIDTIKNAIQGLVSIVKALKDAFLETFDFSKTSGAMRSFLEVVNKLSKGLVFSGERADKLKRSFKGLFAVIDILRMAIGSGLNIVFKILKAVLSSFNIEILDATAAVGDAIVKFRDWLKEHNLIAKAIELLTPIIKTVASAIKDASIAVYDWAKNNETIQRVLKSIGDWFEKSSESIKSWTKGLKEADNIPKYIFSGLVNGLKSGMSKVIEIMVEFGRGILEAVKGVLGIHSPSTEFFEIGKNVIAGFVQGIQNGASIAWNALKSFGAKCIEVIKGIDFGAVLSIVFVGSTLLIANRFAKVLDKFASPFAKLGSMFGAIGDGIKSMLIDIGKYFKTKGLEKTSKAVLNFAISIGILSAAIFVLAKLAKVDSGYMWEAFGMIASLAAVIGILAVVISKIKPTTVQKMGSTLLALSSALFILALALKMLGGMSWSQLAVAGTAMAGLMGIIAILIRITKNRRNLKDVKDVFGKIAKAMLMLALVMKILGGLSPEQLDVAMVALTGLMMTIAILIQITKNRKNIEKVQDVFMKIAGAFAILAIAVRMLGRMSWAQLGVAGSAMGGLTVIIGALVLITKKAKKDAPNIGSTMMAMAEAMALLAITVRLLGGISWSQLGVAAVGITLLTIITGIFILLVREVEKDAPKIGTTLLSISGAMVILAMVVKILGSMSWNTLDIAATGMVLLSLVVGFLILTIREVGNDAPKIASTLLAISGAIAVLATISVLLGLVKIAHLAQGLGVVVILGLILTILLTAAKDSDKAVKPLLAMTAVIGALAGIFYLLTAVIDSEKLRIAAESLVLALLALGVALAVIGKFGGAASGAGLLIAATGLLTIAAALLVLSAIPTEKIGQSILLLAVALVALCGVAALFTVFSAGAGLMTAALLSLAAVILSIGVAVIAFAGALYIVGLALPLLADGFAKLITTLAGCSNYVGEFLKTMVVLSAALAIIAIPLIAVSVAILALSVAFIGIAIAAMIFAGALALVGIVLPLIAKGLASLGDGINSFIVAVSACKGSMDDFKSVMSVFGASVLEVLVKVSAGLALLGIGAIAAGIGTLVLAAGVAALSIAILFGALSIMAMAGAFLVLSSALDVTSQAAEAGKNLVAGFALGIFDSISIVIDAVKTFCGGVVNSVKEFLGIHSPSEVMKALGINTAEGFKLGLDESSGDVEESAKSLAEKAKNGMGEAGSEGGLSFMDGLGDNVDLDSLDLGSMDLESIKSKFGSAGSEGGSSFMDSIGSEVDGNKENITSKFNALGSDSATAFKEGLVTNLNLEQLDIGSIDVNSVKSKFGSAGSEGGSSFIASFIAALNATKISSAMRSVITTISEFKPRMSSAGKDLAKKLCDGLKAQKNSIKNSAKSLASAASSAIRTDEQRNQFKSAGKYLGDGLVEGIKSKYGDVYDAAYALGRKAVKGERDGQASRSPSKLTIKAGKWLGEGLIIGMRKMSDQVYNSSYGLGDSATSGISSAISKVADFVNSDIDAQPTIRPVLDLSDVKSGIGTIGGMFGGQTLSVNTRSVGSIAASMNRRQNGANDDVISAINGLGRRISESSGNSYTINGISYDDNGNVADAIRTLVRAARIEGRT